MSFNSILRWALHRRVGNYCCRQQFDSERMSRRMANTQFEPTSTRLEMLLLVFFVCLNSAAVGAVRTVRILDFPYSITVYRWTKLPPQNLSLATFIRQTRVMNFASEKYCGVKDYREVGTYSRVCHDFCVCHPQHSATQGTHPTTTSECGCQFYGLAL